MFKYTAAIIKIQKYLNTEHFKKVRELEKISYVDISFLIGTIFADGFETDETYNLQFRESGAADICKAFKIQSTDHNIKETQKAIKMLRTMKHKRKNICFQFGNVIAMNKKEYIYFLEQERQTLSDVHNVLGNMFNVKLKNIYLEPYTYKDLSYLLKTYADTTINKAVKRHLFSLIQNQPKVKETGYTWRDKYLDIGFNNISFLAELKDKVNFIEVIGLMLRSKLYENGHEYFFNESEAKKNNINYINTTISEMLEVPSLTKRKKSIIKEALINILPKKSKNIYDLILTLYQAMFENCDYDNLISVLDSIEENTIVDLDGYQIKSIKAFIKNIILSDVTLSSYRDRKISKLLHKIVDNNTKVGNKKYKEPEDKSTVVKTRNKKKNSVAKKELDNKMNDKEYSIQEVQNNGATKTNEIIPFDEQINSNIEKEPEASLTKFRGYEINFILNDFIEYKDMDWKNIENVISMLYSAKIITPDTVKEYLEKKHFPVISDEDKINLMTREKTEELDKLMGSFEQDVNNALMSLVKKQEYYSESELEKSKNTIKQYIRFCKRVKQGYNLDGTIKIKNTNRSSVSIDLIKLGFLTEREADNCFYMEFEFVSTYGNSIGDACVTDENRFGTHV